MQPLLTSILGRFVRSVDRWGGGKREVYPTLVRHSRYRPLTTRLSGGVLTKGKEGGGGRGRCPFCAKQLRPVYGRPPYNPLALALVCARFRRIDIYHY